MRALADAARIDRLMQALGAEADAEARVYLIGGATAVLYGWRASTIDVDLKIVPDRDRMYRALPALKERLEINIDGDPTQRVESATTASGTELCVCLSSSRSDERQGTVSITLRSTSPVRR